jgi:hypothetical protein
MLRLSLASRRPWIPPPIPSKFQKQLLLKIMVHDATERSRRRVSRSSIFDSDRLSIVNVPIAYTVTDFLRNVTRSVSIPRMDGEHTADAVDRSFCRVRRSGPSAHTVTPGGWLVVRAETTNVSDETAGGRNAGRIFRATDGVRGYSPATVSRVTNVDADFRCPHIFRFGIFRENLNVKSLCSVSRW